MTQDTVHKLMFHKFMLDPNTPARLDAMLQANAELDAERAERERCQRNEALYLAAITRWFKERAPCR